MKNIQPLRGPLVKGAVLLLVALVGGGLASQVLAAQFKLGAEQQSFIDNGPPQQGNSSYYAPQMVGNPLQGNAGQQRLQGGAAVVLPPKFMGAWLVQGQRSSIDALPQYQSGIGGLFAPSTQNTWNISGSAKQGYTLTTDQGVSTNLNIHKIVGDNQAFISYQHPTFNTTAKELIVLELQNGGATFQAVEKIQIVKPSEGKVRATVKYNLFGQRQR